MNSAGNSLLNAAPSMAHQNSTRGTPKLDEPKSNFEPAPAATNVAILVKLIDWARVGNLTGNGGRSR